MKNILFLCTGNSCRSQMAEAFAKRSLASHFNVFSAGIKKHGLNPYMLRVMEEVGVEMNGHESQLIEELPCSDWDVVVTVCSHAKENCPILQAKQHIHMPFDDPPGICSSYTDEEAILAVYRRVRDEISQKIDKLVLDLV